MNLDKFNKLLSLIANLGVLVGVFLVAYELQQNRIAIQAQTRSDISSQAVDSALRTTENLPLIEAQLKAQAGDELTPVEERIVAMRNVALFRRWENTHYQIRQGLYSPEEAEGQLEAWDRLVDSPHTAQWWKQNRSDFSRNFAELIDSLID